MTNADRGAERAARLREALPEYTDTNTNVWVIDDEDQFGFLERSVYDGSWHWTFGPNLDNLLAGYGSQEDPSAWEPWLIVGLDSFAAFTVELTYTLVLGPRWKR